MLWLLIAFAAVMVLRRAFTKLLFSASLLLLRSTKPAKVLYAVLFFPGVVIHELAHFFTASFLGVRTGTIDLFPKEVLGEMKLGSVKVAKSDAVRGAAIGAAPLIIGSAVLFLILKWRFPFAFSNLSLESLMLMASQRQRQDLISLYFIFAVSNTMVLSKSDRKELIPAGIIAVAVVVLVSLFSGSFVLQESVAAAVASFLHTLSVTFTLVAAVNIILLIPLLAAVRVLEKLTRKRVKLTIAA